VWLTSFSWCLLLSAEEGAFKPIITIMLLTLCLTLICVKTISYEELKIVTGYSWLCRILNIPEDEE